MSTNTPQNTPEDIPVISAGGTAGSAPENGAAGATGAAAPADAPLEGTDAEAYAALKRRRAERRRKKLIRRGIVAGAVVGVLGIGGIATALLNREPEQTMEPITEMAVQGTFSTNVDASGSLQPLSSTIVTPEVDGTIATVNVTAGQQVAEGDVLMTIKNDELDRAVSAAERDLKAAKAGLESAKSNAAAGYQASQSSGEDVASQVSAALDVRSSPLIASTYNPRRDATQRAVRALLQASRQGSLVQVGGTFNTEAEIANASPEVQQASAEVQAAQEAYDLACAKAAARTVKAPCAGSIIALNAQVGADLSDLAATGTTGPLIQIADLSKMKVTVQVSEEDIASVKTNQTADITCPAFEGLMLTGRVTGIASVATGGSDGMYYEGSSPTFAVDILIDEPDPRLKPGMTAEVNLTTQQLDDVVMVPLMALQTDDGASYYVNLETDPESHATERLDVEVYAQNDDYAVVGSVKGSMANPDMNTAPLADGDVLLVAGGMEASGAGGEGAMDGAMGGGAAVVM